MASRQASFWMLLALAVALGVLFFNVVRPFLLPLLLACVATVLVRPYYEWAVVKFGNRRGLTAFLFSVLFLLVIFLPIAGALLIAGNELMNLGQDLLSPDGKLNHSVKQMQDLAHQRMTDQQWEQFKASAGKSVEGAISGIYTKTQALISNIVELVVGLVITCLALFYFLADGPALLVTLRRLSPLESQDEEILIADFANVCRGVVLSTLVCSFFQAVAAGIGFAIVGVERVWLLSVLTMFTSMIPFVGAAAVWGVVAVGLLMAGHGWAALFLVIYGSTVVSSTDNLLRAYVLRDSAKLHPLVALLSVLGAVQIVGLWGIVLGPIVASFFYAVLKILRDRHWDATGQPMASSQQPLC
ncbi:AI-2E family transporter [Planctomicrobium piriforme]|uniref:Predicted PurR-regulated permease PerM n=1 Tax=Planctomicrobium piriforme TaxID=1576369 RepID=A0A1I3GQW3_9PLAN|nr:AI-2E family transporter [Planctomicrobium piriforme]SFI25731.1 Predicted PurR-regulated permease PerM [Planctomicrobium piriforme]